MLKIAQADLEMIRRHAEKDYPRECCGVLLGRSAGGARAVSFAVECDNTSKMPHNHYGIAPADLIRIQRQARERGLEVVGFYHSHPDQAARWSVSDLEEAHWIGCAYLIVSVSRRGADEMKCFVLGGTGEDKSFEEEPIAGT